MRVTAGTGVIWRLPPLACVAPGLGGGCSSWQLQQLPQLELVCRFTTWWEQQRVLHPGPAAASPKAHAQRTGQGKSSTAWCDLAYASLDDTTWRGTSPRGQSLSWCPAIVCRKARIHRMYVDASEVTKGLTDSHTPKERRAGR